MSLASQNDDSDSAWVARRHDEICDRFENDWRAGQRPRIEHFLCDVPEPERPALLRELLIIELEYRKNSGEPGLPSEYERRFPDNNDVLGPLFAENARDDSPSGQPSSAADSVPKTRSYHPSQTPATPREAGTQYPEAIGKYRIVEKLGEGGQADVFRAVHPNLPGRDVVIKLAKQRLPEAIQRRLLDEGRALARLEHVGVARVYDVDVHETRPFIVMEHIPGRTLRDQLKERRLAPREAAVLVGQLAATLANVHGHGVLHRDLKPANILIDAAGRPRILDFGLALMAQPWDEARPPMDQITGTLQYMAPEQAEGQAASIGPRTDVFGLGAVLYELLTGRPPYRGAYQWELWEQARKAKIAPPRELNPKVPRSLERICLKALAADPEKRYATAADMGRALHSYVWRPRILVAGLGLTALVLAAVLAVAFGPWRGPTEPSLPPGAGPLSGELVLRAWTPGQGKRGLRVGDDPGALPVRNGEQVHLEVRVNQPAYVYLLWLDSQGNVDPLYPWDRDFRKLPAVVGPVAQLHSPPERNKGWEVIGPSGLETAILLARRNPLPADVNLPHVIGKLAPSPLRDPQEVAIRGFDPGKPTAFLDLGQNRGLAKEAAEIDEPLLQLMERMRSHFEMIRAVRFAHQGD